MFALGLLMFYLHSLYILSFYVSEDEYWWPIWTEMTIEQRLLSYALALFANFGLLATPFLRTPGRILGAIVALSLISGLLISTGWLVVDLWGMGLLDAGPLPAGGNILRLSADLLLFFSPLIFRALYATTVWLNALFLFKIVRYPAPGTTGEPKDGR